MLLVIFMASFFGTVFLIVWTSSLYYRKDYFNRGILTSISMIFIGLGMMFIFQLLKSLVDITWLVLMLYASSLLISGIQFLAAKRFLRYTQMKM